MLTPYTVKRAFANIALSQTDSSLVAAVAGKRIRVLALITSSGNAATSVTLNSKGSGAGTAISPLISEAANATAALPFNPDGWFETNLGEALTATTGTGAATGVHVLYAEAP